MAISAMKLLVKTGVAAPDKTLTTGTVRAEIAMAPDVIRKIETVDGPDFTRHALEQCFAKILGEPVEVIFGYGPPDPSNPGMIFTPYPDQRK